MTQVIEIPIGLAQFQLPTAVQDSAEPTLRERLQFLLDRQDAGTQLSEHERQEAEGLVELAEFLSLLKLRSHQVTE
ncbi:hypothetical protein [Chamaesiphon sp. VAR_69_metabat_338]|uniref:hypothetical protein n=1 Tax=Chamaesiphon sp. VAR_69_metabat_338 TaxID=2964704 RepID=UPI00286E40C0|nr:hypothetical protein [Chamaesiphon sp. VAR_69_metabat_338]